MSSWKVCTVEELVKEGILEKPLDGNHGSIHPKSTDYTDDGIPFIMASDLVSGRVDLESCKFISKDMALSLRKGFAKEGDVLLSHKATIGRTALIQSNKFPFIVLTPQVTYYRVKNNKKLNNVYLKNYFDSYAFQSILNQWAGSGSTRAYIGITDQLKLPIVLPPYQEQEKIADILGSFDDKIQLNTQTNQTLEQIAQAIFKSWFVDFDPVKAKIDALANGGTHADAERAAMQIISGKTNAELSQMQQTNLEAYKTLEKTAALFPSEMVESELGEVPKGWGIGCIGDIATAKGGYAFKSSQFEQKGNPVIKIKNITSTGNIILEDCQCINDLVANVASKFKLSDGDFLMAMTGATVGKIGIYVSDGRCAFVNQRVAKFESKLFKNIPCWYTYNLIRRSDVSEKIIGSAQGSAQANISSSGIEQVAIMLPIRDLIYLYQSTVSHLYKKWIANHKELLKLKMTRDTLLPKLLSGELNS
ncbi:restriction endonuclease subunit S [Pasteurella multocida]|uniref:restriction endonuclease subunit S n=1 Tax=Pasteurella multocida TaxID=747 RepID=UPI001F52DE6A|nr:restriction endonuclease subunit S [Pasteurella multocida]